MEYTFLKLAEETLRKANVPLSATEIWKKSAEYGFQNNMQTNGKTPWSSIGAQLGTNIKKNDSIFFLYSSEKPRKFGLKGCDYSEKQTSSDTNNTENEKQTTFNERDLHPLLTSYVSIDVHFHCYTKTIQHEVSSKSGKGKNKWLHPDIVGVYFPFDYFKKETTTIIHNFSESALKLFSFEMKKEIDESNLREYFFQAVSNSSWAHEGYLVALKYKDESKLMDEMRRLNNSFGIGFIKLNPENIEQSEILISAQRKNNIDWDTINRLIIENKNFKDFITYINDDCGLGKVKSEHDYDKILDDKELKDYCKNKHIK